MPVLFCHEELYGVPVMIIDAIKPALPRLLDDSSTTGLAELKNSQRLCERGGELFVSRIRLKSREFSLGSILEEVTPLHPCPCCIFHCRHPLVAYASVLLPESGEVGRKLCRIVAMHDRSERHWYILLPVSKPQNQIAWVSIFVVVLIWSGIRPYEYGTWMLEVAPALIGGAVLWATRKSFPLTPIAYVLILIHCIILMIGGHYTYAEVPLFNWLQEAYDLSRNNYDKVGHFAQGFIPAIVAREIVIRKNVFNSVAWRNFFIICFCLGFSAFYELIEWWVALLSEDAADSFLERRDISGTPSRICGGRCVVRCLGCCCLVAGMTDKLVRCSRQQPDSGLVNFSARFQ